MSAMANSISIKYLPCSGDGKTVNNVKPSYAHGNTDSKTLRSSEISTMWLAKGPVYATSDRSGVMRTSCDYCGRRKRRCDGNGVRVCSLCSKKGLTCTYSKKRPNRPQRPSAERDHGDLVILPQTQSIKRCRLSASPATGLVGMAENVLLRAFFECMGFIPITRQSNVREAMLRIMSSGFATPTLALAPQSGTSSCTGEIIHHSLPSDPRLCSFWSAVTMGGLVQGQPKEAVESYMMRANAIMDTCSKDPTADLARAWFQMAMMSAFSGDVDGFSVNVGRAHGVLGDLRKRGSLDQLPPDLLDLEKYTVVIRLLFGKSNDQDLESFICRDLEPMPQVGSVVTSEEMARFCMHAFHRHGRVIFRELPNHFGGVTRRRGSDLDQVGNLSTDIAATDGNVAGELEQMQKELSPTYERLENVADRPSIRSGIGSLAINMPLFAIRIARQDLSGAVDAASRAIEVLLSYPGLIRYELGIHVCHLLLMVLSTLESAELYEKLRVGYNKHRDHRPAIPPIEEWEGVGAYCDSLFCWRKEQIMREQLRRAIKPELRDNEETRTLFPNGGCDTGVQQLPMTDETNRFDLEKMSLGDSTTISDKLDFDSIYGLGCTEIGVAEKCTSDSFPLGSSGDDPNEYARPTAPLVGVVDDAFDQVRVDMLRPEDWQVAIDALLEDVSTELL